MSIRRWGSPCPSEGGNSSFSSLSLSLSPSLSLALSSLSLPISLSLSLSLSLFLFSLHSLSLSLWRSACGHTAGVPELASPPWQGPATCRGHCQAVLLSLLQRQTVSQRINLPSRRSDTASVGKGGGAVCGLAAKLPCSANCGGGFLAVGGDSFIGTSLKSLLRPGRGGCL